jgi:hypothetical protein
MGLRRRSRQGSARSAGFHWSPGICVDVRSFRLTWGDGKQVVACRWPRPLGPVNRDFRTCRTGGTCGRLEEQPAHGCVVGGDSRSHDVRQRLSYEADADRVTGGVNEQAEETMLHLTPRRERP